MGSVEIQKHKSLCLVFLLFILFLIKSESGSGQSYDDYHHMIFKAEEYYFIQNNVDSSLFYYQKCFESFEFIFARDAINSFQIAYKEARPFEYFLKTAIESGVTPSILSSILALSDFMKNSWPNLELTQDYDLYRAHYLGRINVDCLNEIYRLGIIEQLSKHQHGKHQTDALFKLALAYGLPGERNCGIEELGINKELGREAADFLKLRGNMSEKSGRDLSYYSLDNNSLNMHLPIVIMLHNYCTYKEYESALHEAYLGGFIHPREIGCIYDNALRGDEPKCIINKNLFGLNSFVDSGKIDTKKANQLRAKWAICSIETDRKKEELEKLGYKFIWDYW